MLPFAFWVGSEGLICDLYECFSDAHALHTVRPRQDPHLLNSSLDMSDRHLPDPSVSSENNPPLLLCSLDLYDSAALANITISATSESCKVLY
jgi:hypothetical protein